MLFGKAEYIFYRKDWTYKLKNIKDIGIISYTIYKVVNGSKVEIGVGTLNSGEEYELTFPEENIYEIRIVPDNLRADFYEIKNVRSIKTGIIQNIKDIICNCGTVKESKNCYYSDSIIENYNTEDLNSAYYGLAGLTATISLMFSPSFLRPLYYPINVLWEKFSVKILSDFTSINTNITYNGKLPNSHNIAMVISAIQYPILYAIESDIIDFTSIDDGLAQAQIDSINVVKSDLEANNTEQIDIDTDYNITEIKSCISSLGIDFDFIKMNFKDVYSYGNVGIINFSYKNTIDNTTSVPGYTVTKTVTINSVSSDGALDNNNQLLPEGYIIDQFVITNKTSNPVIINAGWNVGTSEIFSDVTIDGNSTTPIYPYEQTQDNMPASAIYISSANWNGAILDIVITMKQIL